VIAIAAALAKGNVIRHMASVIEADVYVLVDATTPITAAEAPRPDRVLPRVRHRHARRHAPRRARR
jgi:hypothetical protein